METHNYTRTGKERSNQMKVEQIKADSASERVVKQILSNLETGELKPGDRLPTQEKLGIMFGVGRSSIREATNALAIMGYLEIIQGRGSFIKSKEPAPKNTPPPLDRLVENANLFNLIEIREVLECYVVQKAAERADDEHLSQLKHTVDNLEECRKDVGKFITNDLAFHLALALAAKNREIGELVELIHVTINNRISVAFTTSRQDKVIKAIETARKIYEHVIAGEKNQAVRCMKNHLDTTKQALMNELQSRPAHTK